VKTDPAIEIQHLSLRYDRGSGANALNDVSFVVRAGEIFGLLGPNGSGKTSLFRVLNSLLEPSSGTVSVFGSDLARSVGKVRASSGVVFQSQSLDRKLTVAENLRHQGHLYGLHGLVLRQRIEEVLERFRLADRRSDLVETLSGGLKRRLELAKALLHRPRLLLLDEPSTGLDPAARREFWHYLEALNRQDGTTILLTTHFMDEAEFCHQLAVLDQGVLVALDSPAALKSRVGGDVIVLRTREPEALREAIATKFGRPVVALQETLRIETPRGHELIAELVEAFPGKVEAITLSKPSLEDFFIHQTGRAFWHDELRAELIPTTRRS
jgi:ABC-2 type transport system ATP-binding protein